MLNQLKLINMKKKLYYTVEKDEYGHKIISVYVMVNNEPKSFMQIECRIDDNSKEKIQETLTDNGYGDDEYTMILL
jgi:hypothetical protein